MVRERQSLMEHIETLEAEADELEGIVAWYSLHLQDAATNPHFKVLREETQRKRMEKQIAVGLMKCTYLNTIYTCTCMYTTVQDRQIEDLTQRLAAGFSTVDGVFVKALDKALSSFNVERQAYYGGTFIGNHVHKCLEVLQMLKHMLASGYKTHIYTHM